MFSRALALTVVGLLVPAASASATIVPNRGMAGLELTSIRTRSGIERTKEGVGKGTKRKDLRAKLRGEKCRTFRHPKRITICWLGSMTPSKPVTEFRIDSRGRVNNVRVGIVID